MRKVFGNTMVVVLTLLLTQVIQAQKFVHPGIDQTSDDLKYMKSLVLKGEQPWKDAFERMKSRTDLDYVVRPHEHVMRGPYGKPNIGGNELSGSVDLAYNASLIWYITGDKRYAEKAIAAINAWTPVLRDFDFNDAKLIAGLTGYKFCNAAEILKYTDSGWKSEDISSFTEMLMTVYYPLLRYYFPQANGNWNGMIIHSLLAIAIFTDNREIFDDAVSNFLYSPVNGSIFKYIHPSGQCQESTRDQGHVQLGLGEFAGAAQVAYTQGVDLFSAGNNRIALGFEYTAGFLLGHKPHSYGIISERAKNLSDIYEYVYRHYTSKGVELPYAKLAADSVRRRASRSILTAVRVPSVSTPKKSGFPEPNKTAWPAGAGVKSNVKFPANSLFVDPGESIQKALDSLAGTGRWVVAKTGVHNLSETLKFPGGVTLAGEGLSTVIMLGKSSGGRDAIQNLESDMHDVTIRDLVIEGALTPVPPSDPNSVRSYRNQYNHGGIIFRSSERKQMKNINLINLTVQNCTYNGVFISGASGVNVICCDFAENGSSVVPGPKLQHNLLLTYSSGIRIRDSRLDTSPYGSGIAMDHCSDAEVENCEIARNGYYGILISESSGISIRKSFIEANDQSGIMNEFLFKGSDKISISDNILQYNNGYGIESYAVKDLVLTNNTFTGNKLKDQN